jgi:transcription antitermination factor NusG
MDRPSLRLTAADFDAFLDRAGRSSARAELRARALTWARGVVERLAELGLDVEASATQPSAAASEGLRVFFWRDAGARGELERLIDHKKTLAAALAGPANDHKHALLALTIDAARVEVSFEVHPAAWVDARNLRARLAEPEGVLELTGALEGLPEEFAIGLASGMLRRPAMEARAEQIRELVIRSATDQTPVWVGWSVPRNVAVRHSAQLDELLEGAIVALGPVYKVVAWASDNDLLVVGREWEAHSAARERARDKRERDREWDRRKREGLTTKRGGGTPKAAKASSAKHAVKPAASARKEDREPKSLKRAMVPAPAKRAELRLSTSAQKRPRLSRPDRPSLLRSMVSRGSVTDVDPNRAIGKGSVVQVLSGPFVGREGTVQELDGKGFAKVLLGLLATRVPVTDLIASSGKGGRGALATSHRKPTLRS